MPFKWKKRICPDCGKSLIYNWVESKLLGRIYIKKCPTFGHYIEDSEGHLEVGE